MSVTLTHSIQEIGKFLALAEDGDTQRIEALLNDCPSLVSQPGEYGWTALHRAAQFGHTEAAKVLIKRGGNVFALDERRNMPMHSAATGHLFSLPVLVILQIAGSPINARNSGWQSALHVAAQSSNVPGFAYLFGCGARTDFRDRYGNDALAMAGHQLLRTPKGRKYQNQRDELSVIIEILSP